MLGRRPNLVAEDHAADGFRAVRPRCPCSGCRGKATAADGQAGWPAEHGPAAVLSRLRGREPDRIGAGRNVASWIDHHYHYRLPDGRWCWAAEPYSLSARAFVDFRALEDAGYEVYISAGDARHYPGRTVAVSITERIAP